MSITNVAWEKEKAVSVVPVFFVVFFAVTLKLRLGLNLTITMCLSEEQS